MYRVTDPRIPSIVTCTKHGYEFTAKNYARELLIPAYIFNSYIRKSFAILLISFLNVT